MEQPLKLVITNFEEAHGATFTPPFLPDSAPAEAKSVKRSLVFRKEVFIESSDFKEVGDDQFFRLVLGGRVGLMNVPGSIVATKVVKNGSTIEHVEARYEADIKEKPKAWIHWVPVQDAVHVTLRLINPLFLHANPMDKELVPGIHSFYS